MDLSTLWHYFLSISSWLRTFLQNVHISRLSDPNLQPSDSIPTLRSNYFNLLKIPHFLPLNPCIDEIHENTGSNRKLFSFADLPLLSNPHRPLASIPSIISLQSLILILQYVNNHLPFDTSFQNNARRGKRSRMTWRDWLRHSWDSKRRREWIRHMMNKTIHKRYYYDMLRGEKWMDPIAREYEDLYAADGSSGAIGSDEISGFPGEKLNEESQENAYDDTWHLIQDFDRIQYEYLKTCEQFLHQKQSYEFTTFDMNHQKYEIMDHLARAYVYGPLIKDNYYRTLNAEVFQYYDDDAFQLALTEEEQHELDVSGPYNPESRYPRLGVMLMNTLENREKRRGAMLSALRHSSQYVAPEGGSAPTAWSVEVDRVANLLGESLNHDAQVAKTQKKPWFYGKFPWLHEPPEVRRMRHAHAVAPNAFDDMGGYSSVI